MKKLRLSELSLAAALWLALILFSCTQEKTTPQVEKTGGASYQNPIFPGDHPDPSLLVDGEDYYVVHSSFEYYPGLVIWHSTDLINWTPITAALQTYVGSVWAPELIKHEGKYFIYFPASDKNYVITADQIAGPWSEPIELDISMIDPGHIVDDEGNRFLFFSSGSYVPLTKDGLSLAGEPKHVYDGWEIPREWSIECFCMEGPKLFKRGEYFYLTVAEGGTAGPPTGHMVISARAKSLDGPWENSPYNPILRAASSDDQWWSVGHGTVFEDAKAQWWMIFHGYEKDHYNMGRQSMLTPIEWTADGWYKIPDQVSIEQPITLAEEVLLQYKNDYSDPLTNERLNPRWQFFGGYDAERVETGSEGLLVTGKGNSVHNSSPLLFTPKDHSYSAEVEMEIEGDAIGGLILFYNKTAFSGILADKENVLANLRGWQFVTEPKVINRKVFLKLKNINHIVDMYYSLDGQDWIKIENSFESEAYHHNILSGFMSLKIGLTSMGDGRVSFKNFKYQVL